MHLFVRTNLQNRYLFLVTGRLPPYVYLEFSMITISLFILHFTMPFYFLHPKNNPKVQSKQRILTGIVAYAIIYMNISANSLIILPVAVKHPIYTEKSNISFEKY